jgi:hypothetical protein
MEERYSTTGGTRPQITSQTGKDVDDRRCRSQAMPPRITGHAITARRYVGEGSGSNHKA